MKKIVIFVWILFLLAPSKSFAQYTAQTDWIIRDFKSEIVVRNDSSAQIIETLAADCGKLPDKHGIFRVLPTKTKVDNGTTIVTPINLISITDLNGNPYKYSTSRDSFANTLTWKIGDANKTVSGINYYKITYDVGNVIRFQNGYEEFYWNLSGNFWDIPIEKFNAVVTFPSATKIEASKISLYSGAISNKTAGDSTFKILSANKMEVSNPTTLNPRYGVTLSASFPSGTFTPYKFSYWYLYIKYIVWLIPIIIFILSLILWHRYGRDPKIHKTIVPEFEIPGSLDPITMGAIESQRGLERSSIAAEIINFAVKRLIKIQEIPKKNIFSGKDYLFSDISSLEKLKSLTAIEKQLFDLIFNGQKETTLHDLRDSLRTYISSFQTDARNELSNQGYLAPSGNFFSRASCIQGILYLFIIIFTIAIIKFNGMTFTLVLPMIISFIILVIFTILAPKYTQKGAELNHKIKGFKLFIKTAEKYRAQFQEKEGIFEKFLPYAILFGLTKIWINNIKSIYGEDYFTTHPMYFYAGATGSIADFESLDSAISGISNSISSSTGAGGAGGSGGGGGGGGGGGW